MSKVSVKEFVTDIENLILEFCPKGFSNQHPRAYIEKQLEDMKTSPAMFEYNRLHLSWERGWTVKCNMVVNFKTQTVEVSWPSHASMSVAQALAATELHREVVAFAALIEQAMGDMEIDPKKRDD